MFCFILMACLNHYSREKCLLPITGSKSQPNLAVGGQAFPPDRTSCQREGGMTESGGGGVQRGGTLSLNIVINYYWTFYIVLCYIVR